MKTNAKKRMLISSVAMLLVAMIALGTATFAWFTSSTEAYADGMYVRTTKVSNLQVSSKLDTDWRTHVAYGVGTSAANQKIMPISTANGTDWYYASADDGNAFDAKTATKLTAGIGDDTNYNDYYFADQLNIKNSGQVACNGVTITITGLTGDYSRVAIVPVTEAGGSTIKPIDGKNNWTDYIIATTEDEYNAANGTALKIEDETSTDNPKPWIPNASAVVSVTPKTSTTITVGNMAADEVRYFNVYVWFEGQDADCKNANSGQSIPSLKFTVSGTAAAD